jgi:hypothetical protein
MLFVFSHKNTHGSRPLPHLEVLPCIGMEIDPQRFEVAKANLAKWLSD